MNDLYEIVRVLREDLLEERNLDDATTSSEDILRLRKALDNLEIDQETKAKLEFINHIHDYRALHNYFYGINPEGKYRFNHEKPVIMEIFDPLLNYLYDNNYKITLQKIHPDEQINRFEDQILTELQNMEQAYIDSQYQRITSLSKTVLESLFKKICDEKNISYENNIIFPKLYKKVKTEMKIDPSLYLSENETTQKPLRNFTQNLNDIIKALNELRNLYSESHGSSLKTEYFQLRKLPRHHFKLIIDTTKTIVNFIVNSYDYQNSLNI